MDGGCAAVCAPGSKPCGAACIPNDRCCDGACGAGFVCENGGCFAACSNLGGSCAGACGTFCVCDVSTDADVAGCADYDFGVGSCDSNADCPAGTRCSSFIVDGEGRSLCTRPCPCPA